ncbi:hypothetical protein AAEH72_16035 [Shewanella xiamenensis]|nr:hypothetical protein [Shewanella xiamenensis]MCT8869306.1 hypothetical protein [Shewanella xiamenensis]MCT8873851.1 hypothetical protein [Shewanella xiamenensis]MCT8877510.1 hypothetical protein [Shewanella xiamenensis]UWH39953.1 hypothetical protein KXJ80_00170 [Shewanella xiamenensis]
MPKTIWKFTLEPECTIEIPENAQLLSVREQGDKICLWALVDPDAKKVKRDFVGFGTGHVVPDINLTFVGTALLCSGSLVFHIFEKH